MQVLNRTGAGTNEGKSQIKGDQKTSERKSGDKGGWELLGRVSTQPALSQTTQAHTLKEPQLCNSKMCKAGNYEINVSQTTQGSQFQSGKEWFTLQKPTEMGGQIPQQMWLQWVDSKSLRKARLPDPPLSSMQSKEWFCPLYSSRREKNWSPEDKQKVSGTEDCILETKHTRRYLSEMHQAEMIKETHRGNL